MIKLKIVGVNDTIIQEITDKKQIKNLTNLKNQYSVSLNQNIKEVSFIYE